MMSASGATVGRHSTAWSMHRLGRGPDAFCEHSTGRHGLSCVSYTVADIWAIYTEVVHVRVESTSRPRETRDETRDESAESSDVSRPSARCVSRVVIKDARGTRV